MDLMEMLKALFGDEPLTFDQFAEKLNAATDVKLGNLAGGQYVDKNKFEDVNRQLEEANTKYKDFDPDWKTKLEQAQADGDKKLNDYKFEQTIDKAITDAGAADVVSVKANLDMNAVTQDEDGKITGLDEQLLKLKTEKPFLFKAEEDPAKQEKKLNLGGKTSGVKKTSAGGIKSAVAEKYKSN